MSTALPPIEVTPRDLSAYRAGNIGIDYVHRFESGKPGPHVMINGLTHGNEFCGMVAVCHLLDRGVRPKVGTLTLSFANVAAYESFDPAAAVREPADHAQPQPHLVDGLARGRGRQHRAAPRPRDAAGGGRGRAHPRHPFDQPGRGAVLGLSGVRAQCRRRRRAAAAGRAPGDAGRPRLGHAADPARRACRRRGARRGAGGRVRPALQAGDLGPGGRGGAGFPRPLRPDRPRGGAARHAAAPLRAAAHARDPGRELRLRRGR